MDNQYPANRPPVGQIPVNQTPVSQTPVNQTPVSQTPVNQTPVNQTPVNQNPVNQNPVNQNPVNQGPVHRNPTPNIDFFLAGAARSANRNQAARRNRLSAIQGPPVHPPQGRRIEILHNSIVSHPTVQHPALRPLYNFPCDGCGQTGHIVIGCRDMARFALSNRTLSGHLENPRSWVAWMELQNLNQQTASSRLHYANGNVTRRLHVLNRFSGVHRFNPALATDGPGVDDAAATDSNATTRFINLNASSFANTGSASGTSSTSASSNNAASTNTASTIAGSTTAGSTTAGSSTNAGSNDTASDQTTSASAGSTNSGSDI